MRVLASLVSVIGGLATALCLSSCSSPDLKASAPGAPGQRVCQADFRDDPKWTAGDPTCYYWDAPREQYHFKSNIPNPYAYTPVRLSPESGYRLSFDIMLTRCDWQAGINFGLWDADMITDQKNTWYVRFQHGDDGVAATLLYWNSEGRCCPPGAARPVRFSVNKWYRNEVRYDRATGALSLTITEIETGDEAGTQALTGVGTFQGLERLGFSNVGSLSPAAAEGFIRNVKLVEERPSK